MGRQSRILPWEIWLPAVLASGPVRGGEGWPEVSRGHSSRSARRRRAEPGRPAGTNASTADGDADRTAAMPDASRRVAGGTRESTVRARQTTAAAAEHPRHERASGSLAVSSMNRRMPNGTYGGVRGWGREAPAYSMSEIFFQAAKTFRYRNPSEGADLPVE